jgi:hypothetical protein
VDTSLVLLCAAVAFALGYIVARLDGLYQALRWPQAADPVLPAAPGRARAAAPDVAEKVVRVNIDTSTIVTGINTDTITKLNDAELGTKTTTSDTINDAVSRLASLKGQ